MKKELISKALETYDKVQVENFVNYCYALLMEEDKKTRQKKNPWMAHRSEAVLAGFFEKVAEDGLVFDGKHITLISYGISYDYQAYKNKMLLSYPETIIDDDLVYSLDAFSSKKESGKVTYRHKIVDPFDRKDDDIVGGYCVIKNRRGEFITLLGKADITKHRKLAKTDSFWQKWFVEMSRKTIIKKACKKHFDDIYQNIMNLDNESINVDNPLNVEIEVKKAIEGCGTLKDLQKYYLSNKAKHGEDAKEFNLMVTDRKAELEEENENNKS